MTHDEKWMARYEEVVRFIEANHRNPSKHRIEEHNMLNRLKASRKLINHLWGQAPKLSAGARPRDQILVLGPGPKVKFLS